jgi:hypothetical protein
LKTAEHPETKNSRKRHLREEKQMDPIEAIEEIKKHVGIHEVLHKTVYECYRETPNGGDQKITVEIADSGPGVVPKRYHCRVISDMGKKATGNPGATIAEALDNVHWQDLDL